MPVDVRTRMNAMDQLAHPCVCVCVPHVACVAMCTRAGGFREEGSERNGGEGPASGPETPPVSFEADDVGKSRRPGALGSPTAPASPSPLDRSRSGMSEDEWGGADLELPGM